MRALAGRRQRQRHGATVVYGIQPVSRAVASHLPLQLVAYAPDLLQNVGAQRLVTKLRRSGIRVIAIDADLLGRLSGRDPAGGLAAIVSTPHTALSEIRVGPITTVVALDRTRTPGNLGSIVRTADATGVSAVLLLGPGADPWDPIAIRASMGAVFRVPIVRLSNTAAFFEWAAAGGVPVVAMVTQAATPLWSSRLPPRLAVLMGNEATGIDESDVARSSLRLAIPMTGETDSFNLAVATGMFLYEVRRQQGLQGPMDVPSACLDAEGDGVPTGRPVP